MTMQLTADQVWQELEKETFGVLGMVNASNEARTVGIVFTIHDRKLYLSSAKDAWKVRYVESNPSVSMTVPIAKRVPLMPWIKIPPATITFQGTARVLDPLNMPGDISGDRPQAIISASLGADIAADPERLALVSIIEVAPAGEFVTYGVGISLSEMRYPEKSRGRAPVS